jgi:membrane protein DedA with SNARE-associated domain
MTDLAVWLEQLFFSVSPVARLVIVFLSSFAEGLPVIGSILPGGTIALLVGTLAKDGFISLWLAIVLIGVGGFLGDSTGYFIGRRYKHARWLRVLVAQEKHQTKWDVFDRNIAIIVIFGKLIPVVRSTPSIFAGARNIRVQKYLLLSFIGSFVWAFAGVYGGALLAEFFGSWAIVIILGLLILTGIVAVISNRAKNKKKRL